MFGAGSQADSDLEAIRQRRMAEMMAKQVRRPCHQSLGTGAVLSWRALCSHSAGMACGWPATSRASAPCSCSRGISNCCVTPVNVCTCLVPLQGGMGGGMPADPEQQAEQEEQRR